MEAIVHAVPFEGETENRTKDRPRRTKPCRLINRQILIRPVNHLVSVGKDPRQIVRPVSCRLIVRHFRFPFWSPAVKWVANKRGSKLFARSNKLH